MEERCFFVNKNPFIVLILAILVGFGPKSFQERPRKIPSEKRRIYEQYTSTASSTSPATKPGRMGSKSGGNSPHPARRADP